MKRLTQRLTTNPAARRGAVVFATWDSTNLYFATAEQKTQATTLKSRHVVARVDAKQPLEQLSEALEKDGKTTNRLVLLLPRADLEMTSVNVPQVDPTELPAVIHAEIDQLVGDGDHELVVDYMPLSNTESGGNGETAIRAVACSLREDQLNLWQQRATETGFRLSAISPRQLAPLAALESSAELTSPLTVVLVVYSGEVEVTFYRRRDLLFLRTIRTRSTDVDSLSDQIQTEIRRTASLANLDMESEPAKILLLITEGAEVAQFEAIQESLADALSADVRNLQPVTAPATNDPVLLGAADAYFQNRTGIDLLAPKRSPKPPNPVVRWATIGSLAAIALAIGFYFMLADVQTMQDDLTRLQNEVDETKLVAAKLQEKADETRLVRNWLGDSVDWLAHLRTLSDQFPDGQSASVSRLTATSLEDGGQLDLSVQVRDQELVADLESRLRQANFAVTSKQVSEQAGNDYQWRFETRIRFPQSPLDDREEIEAFVAGPPLPTSPSSPSDLAPSDLAPGDLAPTPGATPADSPKPAENTEDSEATEPTEAGTSTGTQESTDNDATGDAA